MPALRLQQGQVWRGDGIYYRIVHLERLEVAYKQIADLATLEGAHHHVSKKEFCRLIKSAALLSQAEVEQIRFGAPLPPAENP